MIKKENYIMTVYGKKGSGKSYFVESFVKNLNRLIVWDTMRIFDNNFTAIYSLKQLNKIFKKIESNEIINFRLSLRLNKNYFDDVNRYLLRFHNITYVIDELQVFVSALKIPEYLNELTTESRHFEINLIFITQRPVFIPRIILANADYIISFEINLKSDLDVLSTYKYFEPETVKTLDNYQFFMVDLKHKKGFKGKI